MEENPGFSKCFLKSKKFSWGNKVGYLPKRVALSLAEHKDTELIWHIEQHTIKVFQEPSYGSAKDIIQVNLQEIILFENISQEADA